MEGIPRMPMVAPEMKVPSQTFPEQLRPSIKEYIHTHYQDDPNKYDKAFDELEQMRTTIARCHADVESICIAKRYYAQLSMMKKRFPMEEHDPIAIPFAWTDRTLDLMNQLIYEDVNFEMCCIIFNIGAAHSQIAANEMRTEIDSIKNAFMHFQWAAWPFQYLRDQMQAARYSTGDFETPYLTFYLNILLAQAQECILEKSMIDNRKPVVVARIAFQLQQMYMNCEAYLKGSGIADVLSSSKNKELERLCSIKAYLYYAIYYYFLGQHADDEKQFGARLFYFIRALEFIKAAEQVARRDKRSNVQEPVQFAFDVISQKEANARKENDFVYHERIPREEELPKYEGVSMVKPIGFDPCDASIAGDDLFRELLPTDVVKAISLYSEEKNRYKREIFDKVVQKDTELENYLLSMKLDQLGLDQPADQVRLPDELLAASAAFTAQPELLPDLLDNFQKITALAAEGDRKLVALKQKLRAITNPIFTSDPGYVAIQQKLEELGKSHAQAKENNAELQRAMATHSANLRLLSRPLSDLTKQICGDFINPGECPEGKQLRRVADKVDEMRKQRCHLVEQLRQDLDSDDITKRALTERELDPKQLFEAELRKHSKSRELIEQNLRAQENILKAMTDANANFADYRRQISEANEKRALQSLTLVTAYNVFLDVVEQTKKAMNFYDQLASMLAALARGVQNMEEINQQFVRDEEHKRQMEEERKRKEMEAREQKRQMQEAAKEAQRAIEEFRFK